ncbi:Zinc finger protein [Wickerhamomyces ciferrii]|uniref:Zinc finger protein n=1 Tax=Wickerhamomyces ciferrii (strain ATCC 14091 / BCRC 22168 / CBS 111 / JCM 3599 / NBRC 0793 / NRRL Y-1031 F-60-10) TaxID=1206466 RepID=K0KPY8_WICCF|nr:Zinc finger protein [Wickerhamomyces ciferrii]CCH44227.1 Zinc finger protein [Wickerhamomyces ciferrii]
MNSIESFVTPSVTQIDSNNKNSIPESSLDLSEQQWIDTEDINLKLQYLVDSSRTNFEEYDSALDQEDIGSSPASLTSYESLLGDDESMATPSFSMDNGLPSPDILNNTNLNKYVPFHNNYHQQQQQQPHQMHTSQPHPLYLTNLPNGMNPSQPRNLNPFMLTPLGTPSGFELNESSGSKVSQYDMEQYRRVMQQTQDFSVADINSTGQIKADQLYSSFQGQFVSNEIYPQVITAEIPTNTTLGSAQSTITQPSSAGSLTNGDTPASSIPPLTASYSSLSSSNLSTPMSAKRKNILRKNRVKKPKTPKVIYDENSKPIAQQLQENREIWESIITKKKKGIYKCTHCTEIFKDLIDLAKHMDANKIARQHKCPFENCPWSIIGLPRRAEVRRHCAAQHAYVITFDTDKARNPNEQADGTPVPSEMHQVVEKYRCEFDNCDKSFKRKDALQRHEKLVHFNPESRFNKRMEKVQQNKLKKQQSAEI